MDEQRQRTLGAWTVLAVPFVVLTAWLWWRDGLTPGFVGLYWFPVIVLTVVGVLDPPWTVLAR